MWKSWHFGLHQWMFIFCSLKLQPRHKHLNEFACERERETIECPWDQSQNWVPVADWFQVGEWDACISSRLCCLFPHLQSLTRRISVSCKEGSLERLSITFVFPANGKNPNLLSAVCCFYVTASNFVVAVNVWIIFGFFWWIYLTIGGKVKRINCKLTFAICRWTWWLISLFALKGSASGKPSKFFSIYCYVYLTPLKKHHNWSFNIWLLGIFCRTSQVSSPPKESELW